MARIPYYDPATHDAKFNDLVGKLGGIGIYRMMAHAEGVLKGFGRLGNALLFNYMMVSRFLENFEVDGEAGQADWLKTAKI